MSYNKKGFLVFILGIVAIAATLIGVVAFRGLLVKADPDLTPTEIKAVRLSPTSAEITFKTEKEAAGSIECSLEKTGPFSLCGAESETKLAHQLKTSIILDPQKEYYFRIKIGRKTYDELGFPFVIPADLGEKDKSLKEFPTSLLGVCQNEEKYDPDFDLNKDGCIRQNDWDLFGR